jgi:hypothetical protein
MNAALNVRNGVAAVILALAIQSSATADTLISTGSVWRYLDTGIDGGTAWREPGFDDSTWASGAAELGYGDADEATLVGFGSNSAMRFVTTYFRREFSVPNGTAVSNAVVRLKRDDGAVVYLNGVEVFRSNMPNGPITYDTLAVGVAPDDGAEFQGAPVPDGLIVSGNNVVAVEMHQVNPASSDLSFDLELTGNTGAVTNPPSAPPIILSQPQNQTVVAGSVVTFSVNVTGTPPLVYRWQRNGSTISLTNGASLTLFNVQTNHAGAYSVMVTNAAGFAISSNAILTVLPPTNPPTNAGFLVTRGSVWKYFDGGVQLGLEQGQDWTDSTFDDSAWSSGPAQLGHGDGDEATIVGQATNVFAKPITVYFRREFNVSQILPGVGLTLSVLRDDGAVIYLNGQEVFRSNMPDGQVSYSTLATAAAGGAEESTLFISTLLSPHVLAVGRNVVAAEIHQNAITSSDLSFDLELAVGAGTNVASTLSVVAVDASASEVDPQLDQVPDPGVFRILRSGPTNETVHVRYGLSGTASNGVDYAGLSGAVDIPAGATSVDIIVDVIDDLTTEANESVQLSLLPSHCIEGPLPGQGCYLWGSPTVATIVIHDNDLIPPAAAGAPNDQLYPATASDGANFLVVWMDQRNADSTEFDIYGARVSASGEVLDPGGIPICTARDYQWYPAVAFDGTNYLVVWSDSRDNSPEHPSLELYGARVNRDGVVLDPNGFAITHGEVAYQPSVAFNGTEYLATAYTWEHNGQRGTTVLGVRVTPAGAVRDTEELVIYQTDPGGSGYPVLVASSGWDWLVVWNGNGVEGARVGRDGTVSSPIQILANGSTWIHGLTAAGSNYFLASFASRPIGTDTHAMDVFGTWITPAGQPQTTVLIAANTNGTIGSHLQPTTYVQDQPAAIAGGSDVLVAWKAGNIYTNGGNLMFLSDIRGARVNPNGVVSPTVSICSAPQEQSHPAIAFNGQLFFATWQDARTAPPEEYSPWGRFDIYGARLTGVGTVIESNGFLISSTEISPPTTLPVVTVIASDPQASEVGILTVVDPGTFTFRRTGDVNLPLSVSFQLSGTASNGVDYQRITNRISFAPGAAEARLNVNPIYDTLPEGQETIVLTLESPVCAQVVPPPQGCYVAGSPNQAIVTLVDFCSPTNQLPPTTLISTGSLWKYIDTGANLGTAWRTPGYDDGVWPIGLDKFGFGEGNEATLLNVWSSNGQQVITYYFRRLFVVSNSAAISSLTLRLLRDDGAVVYLNGTEIRRDSMPAGNITYTTLASLQASDTEERSYLSSQIPAALLVPGVNLLAVEVHQASAVSGDLGFSLELVANAPAGLPLAIALDATNLVWTTGGNAPWFGQTQTTRDGVDAAQSGHVPLASSSWLETTVDGPGLLNYAFQVRTEHTNSTLRLVVDGAVVHTYSLHLGWSGNAYAVPAGRHTLRWLLENPVNGGGSAVAWLDDVVYVREPVSPPLITTQPLSRTNAVGETALFTVTATGTPPLSYQWRRNDVTLPGATNATLIFHNVQTDHAGSYRVVVTNIAGATTSSTAVLTVLSVPPTNPPPSLILITNGSLWKYLDTGEDLGTSWRETDFNDWYWPLGHGQLGFGDGDETTVIRATPDPSTGWRTITFYFRHAFVIEERAQLRALTGRLLVDDGAVVYLNGTEVFRYNLPGGPIAFNTLTTGVAENQVVAFPIPLELLNNGFNVFAVEVHQSAINSSDVSFDLSITAERDPNAWPIVRLVSPQDNAMFNGPTNLTLVAEASDPDGRLVRVEFLQYTNLLGAIVPAAGQTIFTFIASNVPPIGAHTFFARAIDDQGAATMSRALSVGVVTYPIPPVVGVTTPDALVDEDPPRSASFVITRSPARSTPLTVYFDLSGEAVNGEDFELVPLQITIPADASSAEVVISVIDDFDVEDVDPLTLTLRATPPGYIPSFPPGPDGYLIDESQREATIRIEDDDVDFPPAVQIVTPARGSTFVVPASILITAEEFLWDYSIRTVEFFANDLSLGFAHRSSNGISRNWSLVWSNPPPGEYSLGALAIDEFGRPSRAATIPISVVPFIPPQCPWPVQWELVLSNGTTVFKPTDQFKVVHPLPAGGYVLGGESYSNTNGWDYWAVRIDGQGHVLWNRLLGGTGGDQLFDLQLTSDGGFVLGGWSSSGTEGTKTSPNYGGYDFWVVRLDANGNQLWDRSFGGIAHDGIYGLQQTSDGGYILGGASESGVGGNKTSPTRGMYDFWLVRLDANGNKLWDQSYGGAKRDFWARARQMRDGGFVMFGTSESEPGGNKTSPLFGQDNAWIVRTDANGNKLWDQSYGGNRHEWLAGVAELADGALLFAGGSASDAGGNKTSPAFGEGDGFVLVVNADGSKRSDRSMGGTAFDWFASLASMPDGGFLIGGVSQSPVSGNKTSPNVTEYDPWVVRLDASGNKLWDRVAPGRFLADIKPAFDGGFIIAGQSWQDASGLDGWAQKLAPLAEQCDADGDGISDDRDQCANTPTGAVVNAHGCSVAQLCPCDGTWRDHGEYVRCVITHAWQFFRAGLLSPEQRRDSIRNAIQSNCGRREQEPVQLHLLPLTPEECRRDGFQVILSGDADSECIIESSSDLEHWLPVQATPVTITGSEVICPFDDARMRFFRIRLLP